MQITEESQTLLTAVTHEVRNPVTLINSYLQLMSKKHPEICDYPYWGTIQEEMEHLKNLLQDISAYQSGFRPQHKSLTDMNTWLHHYAESVALLLSQRPDIAFFCHIEKNLPSLLLDSSKLKQVLDNLVHNALDAMESVHPSAQAETSLTAAIPDGRSRFLSLRAWSSNGRVCLSVSDNGCGIAPEDADTLFEPFVTHKPEGTGLGLAICRQIVEAHGGTIICASRNQPTEFQITLPTESRR